MRSLQGILTWQAERGREDDKNAPNGTLIGPSVPEICEESRFLSRARFHWQNTAKFGSASMCLDAVTASNPNLAG